MTFELRMAIFKIFKAFFWLLDLSVPSLKPATYQNTNKKFQKICRKVFWQDELIYTVLSIYIYANT